MWILIVIIMGTSTHHPTRVTMQEFTSRERCRAAGEVVKRGTVAHPMQITSASRFVTVECVER